MRPVWNKGLTKEMDDRVRRNAEGVSLSYRKRIDKMSKSIGPLTQEEQYTIYGSLLGDGCVRFQNENNINPTYVENHCLAQLDYTVWKATKLRRLHASVSVRPYNKNTPVCLSTPALPQLMEPLNLFYKNGIKHVPKDVSAVLTPLSIAVWFMDDGSKHNRGYSIATCCFSENDVSRLIDTLCNKFEIQCSLYISGIYPVIKIKKEGEHGFTELIKPYIVPSMEYKLWK